MKYEVAKKDRKNDDRRGCAEEDSQQGAKVFSDWRVVTRTLAGDIVCCYVLQRSRDFEEESRRNGLWAPHRPKVPGMVEGKKLPHGWTPGNTQDSDQDSEGNFGSHGNTSFSKGL